MHLMKSLLDKEARKITEQQKKISNAQDFKRYMTNNNQVDIGA